MLLALPLALRYATTSCFLLLLVMRVLASLLACVGEPADAALASRAAQCRRCPLQIGCRRAASEEQLAAQRSPLRFAAM